MKLEQLTLEIRPRNPWEVMDLAVRLVMSHKALLVTTWMVIIFPILVIINLVLLKEHPLLAFVLIWFLKPLYDRLLLFVLSRVIFSEKTTLQDVLNAVPRLFNTSLFSSLTFYRFDVRRAFVLPVRQLEGLTGQSQKERIHVLQKSDNKEGTFFRLCFHLEVLLSYGFIALLLIMLPKDIAIQGAESIFFNEEPTLLFNSILMCGYIISLILVETIYVAGGFILYLNRRIILEGWDIEQVFLQLAQRQKDIKIQCHSFVVLCVGVLCFLLSTTFSMDIHAMQQNNITDYQTIIPAINPVKLAPNASKQVITSVMDDPIFNTVKEVQILEYIRDKKQPNSDRNVEWLRNFIKWMVKILAVILKIVLWVLVFIAIILLIKYRHRLFVGFGSTIDSKKTKPDILFGLDVRKESLPNNIIEQVLKLYHAQKYRDAMALLYRATLSKLVQEYHFDLKKGATEGDCLNLVVKELPIPTQEERDYFTELTKTWQLTAYAHQTLSEKKIKCLCRDWSLFYKEDNDHE